MTDDIDTGLRTGSDGLPTLAVNPDRLVDRTPREIGEAVLAAWRSGDVAEVTDEAAAARTEELLWLLQSSARSRLGLRPLS
ncbi:hypothetical protein [Phytomonospora endophytica]|uniref:Uncharacterized protein n=1 Tax=Phytomonospora endophytica TaxID=714109 RepID=A0A841FG08_9ACTN|nr:hypothetical protein [Phytomonospora endophytica]MBB6034535.1 hypothetical protein [Phytomonospora endophytica]GIG70443.1 hypothetical protein Pen01_67380 [Phytomonospora endophytica]